MFDKFQDDAKELLAHARKAAQTFNHDFIGTEHLLLGALGCSTGVALMMLYQLGVPPERIRSATEGRMKRGDAAIDQSSLPFSPNAKRVLERAMREAAFLGHDWLDSGHLLLSMALLPDTTAGAVLAECGFDVDMARTWIRAHWSSAGAYELPTRMARLEAEIDLLRKRVEELERDHD